MSNDGGRSPGEERPERSDRFEARVAVAAAAVALATALLVVLSGHASDRAASADRRAEAARASAVRNERHVDARFDRAFQRWVQAERFARRGSGAAVRAQAEDDQSARVDRERERAWAAVQATLRGRGDLADTTGVTPDWTRVRTRLEEPAKAAYLRRQAAVTEGSAWARKASHYQTLVVVSGAVLFLIGISGTLGRRDSRVPRAAAAAIVVVGAIAAVHTRSAPIHVPSDRAVAAVARGETEVDVGNWRAARRLFTEAIHIDPDYAAAWAHRADIPFVKGQATTSSPFLSYIPRPEAAASLRDAQRAIALGDDDDLELIATAGFQATMLDRYDLAEGYFRRAVQLNHTSSMNWMNLGLAQLAQGEVDASARSYRIAERHMRNLAAPYDRLSLRYSALSDLEVLLHARPQLRGSVERTRTRITAIASAELHDGTPLRPIPGEVTDLRMTFSQGDHGRPTASATLRHLAHGLQPVTVVWYRKAPGDPVFAADPAMNSDSFWWAGHDDRYDVTDYAAAACDAAADYRADFYLGSRFAGSVTGHAAAPALRDMHFIDDVELGVELCQPAGWRRRAEPGRLLELISPTGERFSVEVLAEALPKGTDAESAERAALRDHAGGRAATPSGLLVMAEGPSSNVQLDALTERVTAPDGSTSYVTAVAHHHRMVLIRQRNVDPATIASDDILVTLRLGDPVS